MWGVVFRNSLPQVDSSREGLLLGMAVFREEGMSNSCVKFEKAGPSLDKPFLPAGLPFPPASISEPVYMCAAHATMVKQCRWLRAQS
jgi:hypothetical protein